MARTKQTARKSTGGKAPRKMLACKSVQQFRSFMTSQQSASYATSTSTSARPDQKTSYLNYENMFYSYYFNTGPLSKKRFETRFKTGAGKNPVTREEERWLGMSFNSMFDGKGIKTHGRPNLNVVIVLDVSGSMGLGFSNESAYDGGNFQSKLKVAKECLTSLVDQLKPNDSFGLVRFNHTANVQHKLMKWRSVKKATLQSGIFSLIASGSTCLTAAIECATDMFSGVAEDTNATNRIIFLTDLCSTVDSVNDEKKLLAAIQANAERAIFTSVVGIGMDLNVRLVEEISKTRGAKYLSVDNPDEFKTIMNQDFDYDVTVMAFNIRVTLLTKEYELLKGYGSPEVNNLKPGKPIVISSEFPSWQNDHGESKGGTLLFKFAKTKKAKMTPTKLKLEVKYEDNEGVEHCEVVDVPIQNNLKDSSVRKAALLVHYVDLHNDYVLDARKSKVKFLELFQTFRDHFTSELTDMKDKSLTTYNKGDLELIDKIIELETNPLPSGNSSSTSTGHSSSMLQSGAFFSCAPVGGGRKPAGRVGGVRKTIAPVQKKAGVRKTTKGAAKRVTLKPPSSSKTSAGDTTKPAIDKSSRKRPSTRDTSQVPDAKKPRRVATRSSTRNQSRPQGGKSVTTKAKPITKEAAKATAGPKKPISTTRTRQPKGGNTRAKVQKLKSVANRRSTRRTK